MKKPHTTCSKILTAGTFIMVQIPFKYSTIQWTASASMMNCQDYFPINLQLVSIPQSTPIIYRRRAFGSDLTVMNKKSQSYKQC